MTSRSQAKATIGFTYDNSKSVGDSDKDDDDDDDSSDSDSDSILSDIGKWGTRMVLITVERYQNILCHSKWIEPRSIRSSYMYVVIV